MRGMSVPSVNTPKLMMTGIFRAVKSAIIWRRSSIGVLPSTTTAPSMSSASA